MLLTLPSLEQFFSSLIEGVGPRRSLGVPERARARDNNEGSLPFPSMVLSASPSPSD